MSNKTKINYIGRVSGFEYNYQIGDHILGIQSRFLLKSEFVFVSPFENKIEANNYEFFKY